MSAYAKENLLRLMAAAGLSIHELARQSGLDERTIRGVLNGGNKPHARTLHRLAEGLQVKVDELFLDPRQLLGRRQLLGSRFDRQTNPMVEEVLETHRELFVDWTEADFDELFSRVGAGGALTREGALDAVCRMNRKRQLHDKLDLLLESSHAQLAGSILDALYEQIVVDEK